ncbi:response regulator [Paenibacillus alginolyticus]|uniref:response regulator n=1 Tax=Paenibacillus alginolyticus TaxID=59839 RepID=UPI0004246A8A|nr:response regulator [Paenibacillus alginolyticus]MCY9670311.1 response regulator [Paenibacillus alginolyticus]
MLSVVIVEDEYIVRYGIRSMIEWEKMGLTVIGEASNGQEALDFIRQEPPDILITDIKMPIMDGIGLISEVRKFSPHMKILILSNLEDFQYAKEAIRYGVSEYLIKSDMMPRDFEQALMKVKESLEEASPNSEEKQSASAQPLWKEKLLLDLVEGSGKERIDVQSSIESLGLLDAKLPLYVLHIGKNALELGITEGQTYIRSALDRVLAAEYEASYEVFPDRLGEMNVLLFSSRKSQDLKAVREIAQSVLTYLLDRYAMLCTIGVSKGIMAWTDLQNAHEQAVTAAKYKMFIGSGKVIVYGVDYVPVENQQVENIKVSTSHIHSMVYAFQSKELQVYLEEIFEHLASRKDYDMVQIISLELLIMLTTLWSDVSSDQQDILHLKKQYFDQLAKLETIQQSKAWFLQAFEELVQHMIHVYNSDRNGILKAVQYIQMYYHQEISLQSISHHVHLSKNYFANLFKKEMGESFLEHLTRIRIEKAKALLTGELKAGDIGHLVGIQDPKYFSKVFKKITGVSPSEYRNRTRGDV